MKTYKILTSFLLLVLMTTSCEKLKLLDSEDPESIPAGSNLKNLTIWEFLSQDNFHQNDLTSIGMYGRAVEHAGLKNLLNDSNGNYTVIVPNDITINNLITSVLGYTSLEDVPPAVLKNLLSSTIIDQRVRSFDLAISETKGFQSINNDSLFFTRVGATGDIYRLTINSSPSVSSNAPTVRTQNLETKNGVIHVVPSFTNYIPKLRLKDVGNTVVKADTIPVTKDSYINGGSSTNKNKNFGSLIYMSVENIPTSMDYTRRSLVQFPVRAPNFTGRISSVEVALFLNRIDGDGSIIINEDENVDWDENTITWNNAPAAGAIPLYTFPITVSGSNFKWQYGVITTAYTNAIAANKSFINVGVFTPTPKLIQFATKEAAANRRPFLIIKSVAETVLKDLVNNPITIEASTGVKTINQSELSLGGTTANNIFYTIKALPTMGIIVINGLPAAVGSSFSQELLNKGGVKYLYTGTGNADTTVLEASDFQNGFYDDLITLNFNIQ